MLRVAPYFRLGCGQKLMLIGQDPTINRNPDRVRQVLMLDDENGQLSRWLKGVIGERWFSSLSVYATNLVKCTLPVPPSKAVRGAVRFLQPYFANCQGYLREEILNYQPDLILTLGEPAHILFRTMLDNQNLIPDSMQGAFTGEFSLTKLAGFEFHYSPCLHISTFRVAEVYGDSVKQFKQGLSEYFEGGITDEE